MEDKIYEENDKLRLEIERLTEKNIEELCKSNFDYLRKIQEGKEESHLHTTFFASRIERDKMPSYFTFSSVAFTDNQVAAVHKVLFEVSIRIPAVVCPLILMPCLNIQK